MKHLLFEENGDFKAASVLADSGATLQVELPSGRRSKIKASAVLLRFDSPDASELIPAAQKVAEGIDLEFLWECAPRGEFGFAELADEYFGGKAGAVEAGGLLMKLHSAPIWFHRKGRGRYAPAPEETLRAALAAVERRRLQEEQIERDAQAMAAGQLPEEVGRQAARLLVKPDKMSLAWKALDRAVALTHKAPERLLLELGAFRSAHGLHFERFAAEWFPGGTGFALRDEAFEGLGAFDELPLAEVEAFSVDDSTTTEIDDCLSVTPAEGGGWRVGIHIAAPGLGISPGSALDAAARERMSTVYMPGDKITMLPARAVAAFSLDVGRVVPAVSFYADVEADGTTIRSSFSRAERIRVAENLRHDLFDGVITEQALAASQADAPIPFGDALRVLWKLTHALCAQRERVRGKPEPRFRTDFSFYVDRDGGEERVRIVQRRRDAPLDRIVAEMMILANSEWGGLLAQHQVPGIYRSQQNGRVRMTTWPQPHQGLGVPQYVWASSPLRRYVDLVNQRQLLAVLTGGKPPFGPKDAELFSIVSAFDARYSAYLDFQHSIERYWCLRWVAQQGLRRADAVVVREDLVRLADAPLYFRLPGAPSHPPGRRIVVDVLATDEVDLSVEARFVEVAPPRAGEAGLVEELAEELAEEALEDGALLEGDAAAPSPEAAGGQGSAGGRGEAASQAGDAPLDAAV